MFAYFFQSDVHADTRSPTARKLGVNSECDYVPPSDGRSLFAEGHHAGRQLLCRSQRERCSIADFSLSLCASAAHALPLTAG